MTNELKLMGNEYQFHAEGDWLYVAQATRATKEAISSTRISRIRGVGGLFASFDQLDELEARILRLFLVPTEEESFGEYKQRFVHGLAGDSFKGKLAGFLMGQKIPMAYYLETSNRDRLSVDLKVRENQYDCILGVSGISQQRGEKIADKIGSVLTALPLEYTATPMLETMI